MSDNFNIKQYLIENKMTEASRGEVRKHFGMTLLNKNVVLERSEERDLLKARRVKMIKEHFDRKRDLLNLKESKLDRDALYKEFMGYVNKYGEDKAWKIIRKFHPEVDFDNINIIPTFARKNSKVGAQQDLRRLNRVSTFDDHSRSSDTPTYDKYGYRTGNTVIDEAGYTDDDDFVEDDDFIGATGSDAELGIATDKRASAAARRGMKGTELDVDAPEEKPDYPDMDDDNEEDFQDPEDLDSKDQPISTGNSDIDTAKIFGKNAPYVEVLVDDLGQYLKGPRGNWRVNVSSNLLRRAIDSVRNYMDEFDYPKKGFLLAPNKMGNYDEIPVLGNNTLNNTPKAVVWVHREAIN